MDLAGVSVHTSTSTIRAKSEHLGSKPLRLQQHFHSRGPLSIIAEIIFRVQAFPLPALVFGEVAVFFCYNVITHCIIPRYSS